MRHLSTVIAALMMLFSSAASLSAQTGALSKGMREGTIEGIIGLLKEKYSYPEVAVKMEAELRMRQKRGDYDSLADGKEFAAKVTSDLRGVFDDKHLVLSYSAEPIPVRSAKAGAPRPEEIEQARMRQRRENFGAQKVEILPGNVGLVQINYFAPLALSADAYAAAMNYVADTDALIIDLRQNSGSMDINTMPFFTSYLFDEPVLFGDITVPGTKEARQLWTYAQVPGRKYGNKNVYVLTSRRTASGAEGFVSAMRRLKRATMIGETTRGATMPGGSFRVNEHFSIWISTGRSSAGRAELENKGVEPDIATAPEAALNEAHRQALDHLIKSGSDPDWKAQLEKIRADLKAN